MQGNQTFLDPPDLETDKGQGRASERKTMAFSFDKSYWSAGPRDEPQYCSQQTLYDDLGRELLDHGFNGFNACILACKWMCLGPWNALTCLNRWTDWLVTVDIYGNAFTDPIISPRFWKIIQVRVPTTLPTRNTDHLFSMMGCMYLFTMRGKSLPVLTNPLKMGRTRVSSLLPVPSCSTVWKIRRRPIQTPRSPSKSRILRFVTSPCDHSRALTFL